MISVILLIILQTRSCKLPRTGTLQKQNIQLLKRAILGLRQPEVGPNSSNQTQRPPKECRLSFLIPQSRVHHIRF
jgi:hypothetical protein